MLGHETELDALRIRHDIQHSQRALPALALGPNTISFSAGAPEGTVTVEAATDLANRNRQLVHTDYHPDLTGVEPQLMHVSGGKGDATFPIATPGEMTRLRIGGHYRARDAQDGWDLQVSYDDGRSFTLVDRLAGPTPGHCQQTTVTQVPARTHNALVRWSGQQRNTTCLFSFSINADYRQPGGGFRPVRISYRWNEAGVEKEHIHIAQRPTETYQIECSAVPTMKSIVLELAE